MNEVVLALFALLSILLTAVCSFFWQCGGRDNKALQEIGLGLWGWNWANRFWGRVFAPLMFSTMVGFIAFHNHPQDWWRLVFMVWPFISSTLPHEKPIQRMFKALFWCSAGAFVCVASGRWWLLGYQFVSGLAAQGIWGTKNPTPAPVEELGIYFAMSWLIPIMAM